jgi:class 3 adenylate cyclase
VRDGHARALAEQIASARLVELPGDDNIWFAEDADAVIDHLQSFLTGVRAGAVTNRVLSTVLFTDIANSTQLAAGMGDQRWSALLATHDELVARHVESFRGRMIKSTGDGVLAIFDGPARAIQCASEIRDALRRLDLSVRVGLHTGEVEMTADGVGGIAVHIAARIVALAEPGEILVSGAIPPLVHGLRDTYASGCPRPLVDPCGRRTGQRPTARPPVCDKARGRRHPLSVTGIAIRHAPDPGDRAVYGA